MSKVRVAHATTIAASLRYLLLNQLCAIQQSGFDVVGISTAGPDVPVIEASGIRHISVPMTRTMSPLADFVSLIRLFLAMRRERFTIVHTHTPKPGLLGQVAARLAGVPVIVNTVHGFYFHDNMHPAARRFYIWMEKMAARCSDLILSQNSEDIQTAICEKICDVNKIKFLGNGIDVTYFHRTRFSETERVSKRAKLGIPVGSPVIGFVGRLVAEKGILEFLEAGQVIARHFTNVRFLIVGPIDHEKPDALTPAIAEQYSLQSQCIFTGHWLEMPELYNLMDIFVLPSHREGFPRSVMEASAMGVPCVVTDIRGCREAVEHEQNGLLVPLKDSNALAVAIEALLSDPERASLFGARGREMAEERFDEQKVFHTVITEYQRLLKAKGLALPLTLKSALEDTSGGALVGETGSIE